jgi:[amino group carrier protein]-L-2-aminoadipate 6-kinase
MVLVVKIGGANGQGTADGGRQLVSSANGGAQRAHGTTDDIDLPPSSIVHGPSSIVHPEILDDIATLTSRGERVVLVHGGSGLTDELSNRLGHPARTITSPGGMTSRHTDPETLRIFAMAVAGEINTEIVSLLQRRGVNALGLAGVDGRLLVARRKDAIRAVTPEGRVHVVRDSYTGQIEQVNAVLLAHLLDAGYTPVVAPLALGHDGERLNVDGDRAAAAIAVALNAGADALRALAIMTNVPGLLTDRSDPATLLRHIPAENLAEHMTYAHGRMRTKLLAAQEASQGGVPRICIGTRSLLATLDGSGTTILGPKSRVETESKIQNSRPPTTDDGR